MTLTTEDLSNLHKFSSDDYEKMAEHGLVPASGVELIYGMVVHMSPKGDRHTFVVNALNEILVEQPNKKYWVSCESLSLRALPNTTPDPDIALARLVRSYARRRPTPAEIALIIEVANASYDYDIHTKKAIYAEAGIPGYWVFDIREGRDVVEMFRRPENGQYADHRLAATPSIIAPQEFPEIEIELARAFGFDQPHDQLCAEPPATFVHSNADSKALSGQNIAQARRAHRCRRRRQLRCGCKLACGLAKVLDLKEAPH